MKNLEEPSAQQPFRYDGAAPERNGGGLRRRGRPLNCDRCYSSFAPPNAPVNAPAAMSFDVKSKTPPASAASSP